MAGAGGSSKGSSKGGSDGQASNAALHDAEDLMARRKVVFREWKAKRQSSKPKHPNHLIDYSNSPQPKVRN
jgi:hypothetical protein